MIVYVGEVCRYLVNQPSSPLDKQHSVRLAIGNGLRTNIWPDFVKRFGVRVMEFYGASEGNCTISKNTYKQIKLKTNFLIFHIFHFKNYV